MLDWDDQHKEIWYDTNGNPWNTNGKIQIQIGEWKEIDILQMKSHEIQMGEIQIRIGKIQIEIGEIHIHS